MRRQPSRKFCPKPRAPRFGLPSPRFGRFARAFRVLCDALNANRFLTT